MKIIKFLPITILLFLCCACDQLKEADLDRDGEADVLIRGQKIKDANKLDNIFVIDDVVVNGVTNEQWYMDNDMLEIVEHPTFKMEYDPMNKVWSKISLK